MFPASNYTNQFYDNCRWNVVVIVVTNISSCSVKIRESPKPEPTIKPPAIEQNGDAEHDIFLANRLRLAQKMGGPKKKADKQ